MAEFTNKKIITLVNRRNEMKGAGLLKTKQPKWKDTNVALIGSDMDKECRKKAAEGEKAWEKAGKTVGLQIWHIVQFKVKHVNREDYGKFYNGDSYIILNTYKKKDTDKLEYDLHFWIGEESTSDEYGTAAFKTVELDALLDDEAVQHREVEGNESDLFKSYFKTLIVLQGGVASGFNHVTPQEYKPRLFWIEGYGNNIQSKEVPLNKTNISSDDAFLLDCGLRLIIFYGQDCSPFEKLKATKFSKKIQSERSGRPEIITLDEDSDNIGEFLCMFPETGPTASKKVKKDPSTCVKKLFRIFEKEDSVQMELVEEGKLSRSSLKSNDVFLVDTGVACFVWIGRGASSKEKGTAILKAQNYLSTTDHPSVNITTVKEGKICSEFENAFF